jgi:glutaredoxin
MPASDQAYRTPGVNEACPARGTIRGVPTVTVYGRPGCHLCDDALAVLDRVRAELPFELVPVDIEADDALLRAYLERIPVVALDGDELYDYVVDEADLRARLARVDRG